MILFCGIPSEPPMALAIQAAVEIGLPHVVFNQRQAAHSDITVGIDGGRVTGALWARESEWPLESFTGAYMRMVEVAALPETRPGSRLARDPLLAAKSAFLHDALGAWLESAHCCVVNRVAAMSSNASKPYQAQLIAATGFAVPTTLVTNDPEELKAFARVHGRVIYKSVSSVRSIVREWSPERRTDIDNLRRLRHLPTQFQAYVPGVNVRVHVVGQQVFATEIGCDAVDYRYASRDGSDVTMQPVILPDEELARCVLLSERLDLPFCGIDLKRTPDGEYFCFEVNPSPAYSYYEQHTGQPIARSLVTYLSTRGRGAKPVAAREGELAACKSSRTDRTSREECSA